MKGATMARSISLASASNAATVSAPAPEHSSFVTFEQVCEEIQGLEAFLDSAITKSFINQGVVDEETMTFKKVHGSNIQLAYKAVLNDWSEKLNMMWNSKEKEGTLIVPGTDIEVSPQEAAAIQTKFWGSSHYKVESLFHNHYFVLQAKKQHREFLASLDARKRGDYTSTPRKGTHALGKGVSVSTNLGAKLAGVKAQA